MLSEKLKKDDRYHEWRKRQRKFKSDARYRKPIFWATVAASLVLLFLVIGILGATIAVAYYSRELPSPNSLISRNLELSTKILDRNGELLYDVHGEKNRVLIKLDDVPKYVRDATIAIEDKNFYQHHGFDLTGIIRSVKVIVTGQGTTGGSTLTQQFVKNAVLSPEQKITRKIKELVLSMQIERRYTKDEILQMYLNEIPYGGQAWGIEAASQMYFGKATKDLTLAEASFLAGLPQSPSLYSPYSNMDGAKWRQEQVLRRMVEDGYIKQEEADAAKAEELEITSLGQSIRAAHFTMYVKSILAEKYGDQLVEQGGLKVTTSLDIKMQEDAENIVYDEVNKAKSLNVGNGSLVAMDPKTGQVLVMVGSKDYWDASIDGNVNVAVSPRQPGSSIKPLTYVTALKQGYTAATPLMDVQTTFPGGTGSPDYTPVNYDGVFRGPIQFRYALGNSINITAVKLLKLVGIPAMLETAHQMGITTLNEPERYGLSLTLGGGEVYLLDMVDAYSVFAAQGVHRSPVTILKVDDRNGKVLEEWKPNDGQQVLTSQQSYIMSEILADNYARSLAFGENSILKIPNYQVAVKTGTTDNKKDNWTVGYTPSLVVGVWVGNTRGEPMNPKLASGITGAAPIWNRAMKTFLPNYPKENFTRPSGIVTATVDKVSGLLPGSGTGSDTREEMFIEGTVPQAHDDWHKEIEICTVDNKLASDACRRAGKVEKRSVVALKEQLSEWQSFLDAWMKSTNDPRYSAPTEVSKTYFNDKGEQTSDEKPVVEIHKPGNNDEVSREFEASFSVWSPNDVVKVEFFIDGTQFGSPMTTFLEKPSKKGFNLSSGMSGEHKLKIRATDSAGNEGSSEVTIRIKG